MRYLYCGLLAGLLGFAGAGQALELGAITLTPATQTSWQAQVELLNDTGVAADDLNLHLGSAQQHAQAGINPAMIEQIALGWHDNVERTAITVRPVNIAPGAEAIRFLIQVRWPQGSLTRGYQVTLGAMPTATALGQGRFGPTQAADTLFSIANALRPSTVATNQMMLALLAENPRAFNAPNVNALQRNVLLNVPPRAALEFPDATAATAQVREQIRTWEQTQAEAQQAIDRPLRIIAPPVPAVEATDSTALPEPESESAPATMPNTAVFEQPQWQGLQSQLSRVESSNARLASENAQLQSSLSALREDVAALEQRLSQPVAQEPEVNPLDTSAEVDVEAVKAWLTGQYNQAIGDPAQAFTLPLVRWSSAGLAILLGLLLLTALMAAKRRQGRADDPAALPANWRANSARASEPDDQTVVSSAAESQGDPIEQASALIAYGKLEQAQNLLDEALGEAPDRIDLRIKLLDVLAMREDQAGFEAEAHVLHAQLADEQDPRWQRVARQGRDLSGSEHPLFAATASADSSG